MWLGVCQVPCGGDLKSEAEGLKCRNYNPKGDASSMLIVAVRLDRVTIVPCGTVLVKDFF